MATALSLHELAHSLISVTKYSPSITDRNNSLSTDSRGCPKLSLSLPTKISKHKSKSLSYKVQKWIHKCIVRVLSFWVFSFLVSYDKNSNLLLIFTYLLCGALWLTLKCTGITNMYMKYSLLKCTSNSSRESHTGPKSLKSAVKPPIT